MVKLNIFKKRIIIIFLIIFQISIIPQQANALAGSYTLIDGTIIGVASTVEVTVASGGTALVSTEAICVAVGSILIMSGIIYCQYPDVRRVVNTIVSEMIKGNLSDYVIIEGGKLVITEKGIELINSRVQGFRNDSITQVTESVSVDMSNWQDYTYEIYQFDMPLTSAESSFTDYARVNATGAYSISYSTNYYENAGKVFIGMYRAGTIFGCTDYVVYIDKSYDVVKEFLDYCVDWQTYIITTYEPPEGVTLPQYRGKMGQSCELSIQEQHQARTGGLRGWKETASVSDNSIPLYKVDNRYETESTYEDMADWDTSTVSELWTEEAVEEPVVTPEEEPSSDVGIISTIEAVGITIGDFITNAIDTLITWLCDVWDTLFDWLSKIWNAIKAVPKTIVEAIEDAADLIKTAIDEKPVSDSSDTPDISESELPNLDFTPLTVGIKDKFPFCIPWDIVDFIDSWSAGREEPSIIVEFPEEYFVGGGSFEFSFKRFEKIIIVLRYVQLLGFYYFMMKKSRALIGSGGGA